MQRINLYLPEYRPKREWLTLDQCVLGFAVFVITLAALYRHQNSLAIQARWQAESVQQQQEEKQQRIEQLSKNTRVSDKAHLQAEIQELRAAISNRQAIINVISSNDLGNKIGFSQHLFSLGQQRLDDLVVQRLVLTQGAKNVELEGVTNTPASVPLYVHRLQQSPPFSESKFGALAIRKTGEMIHFSLGGNTAAEGAELRVLPAQTNTTKTPNAVPLSMAPVSETSAGKRREAY
jgi:hypothetical protein